MRLCMMTVSIFVGCTAYATDNLHLQMQLTFLKLVHLLDSLIYKSVKCTCRCIWWLHCICTWTFGPHIIILCNVFVNRFDKRKTTKLWYVIRLVLFTKYLRQIKKKLNVIKKKTKITKKKFTVIKVDLLVFYA